MVGVVLMLATHCADSDASVGCTDGDQVHQCGKNRQACGDIGAVGVRVFFLLFFGVLELECADMDTDCDGRARRSRFLCLRLRARDGEVHAATNNSHCRGRRADVA